MTISAATISRLQAEQHNCCAVCGLPFTPDNPAQVHHAIYTRNKKFAKLLDMPENLALVCMRCHTELHGYLTSWWRRCVFYQDKIAMGYDMRAWNESLKEAGMVTDYFIDTATGETSGERIPSA